MAGIEETGYIQDRDERFWNGFDKIPWADWAKVVYALFGDNAIFCSRGYRGQFPVYEKNRKLELIYRWLDMIGYKMSSEETELLTGEHEAYKAGDTDGKV
jgi:hypothetical protein